MGNGLPLLREGRRIVKCRVPSFSQAATTRRSSSHSRTDVLSFLLSGISRKNSRRASERQNKCTRRDSNPQPSVPKSGRAFRRKAMKPLWAKVFSSCYRPLHSVANIIIFSQTIVVFGALSGKSGSPPLTTSERDFRPPENELQTFCRPLALFFFVGETKLATLRGPGASATAKRPSIARPLRDHPLVRDHGRD
jgi:hypothetical protein